MTDLAGLTTLLAGAATSARVEAALLQAEISSALLDILLATPVTSARVAARAPDGALVLQTAKGPIALPNGPDLPPGTEVEVRLASRSPTLVSVRIVALPTGAATAPSAAAAAPPAAPAAEIVRSTPLPAVLLAGPPDDPREPGTPLLVRILGLTAPAPEGAPTRAGKGAAVATAETEPAPRGRAIADPASMPVAPDGRSTTAAPTGAGHAHAAGAPAAVTARAAGAMVPDKGADPGALWSADPAAAGLARAAGATRTARRDGAAMPMPLPPSADRVEGELVGPVVTRTAAGAVIQTPHHTVAVEGLDVAEGALVRFLLLEPPSTPAPRRDARKAPWSTLGETLRSLERAAPEVAARLAADLQPHDPPRLAATIRLLAAALKDDGPGFPGKSLDDALREAGRGDLVPTLREEVKTLGRSAAEPSQQWQVLPLPLHDGAQLTPAFLYVERDARRDRETGEEARRFVVDVQTRALGRLQLDGLLRPRRFDLLLRSRVPLDEVMRGEIEQLFRATLDSAGWSGEVAFSTAPAFTDEPAGKYRERVAALA